MSNRNAVYTTLGASNHVKEDRAMFDYYATDPRAGELLLEQETFDNIWECACGEGHLAQNFSGCKATDIVDRGFGDVFDFLSSENGYWNGDIITNPPYKYALEFIQKALSIIPKGKKVAMFLKVQFLETVKRKLLFTEYPPKVIYVSSSRIPCAKNGDFNALKKSGGSAIAYAWFVWVKGYREDTIVKWIN